MGGVHSTLESSRLSRRGVLAAGVGFTGVALTATPAAAHDGAPTTPTAALARLLDGNLRVRANVRHQIGLLLAGSAAVRAARAAGALAVVGARYDLDEGAVTLLR